MDEDLSYLNERSDKERKLNMGLLVQYTIRSKQSYIFRTNKLLEIAGASKIISDTYDVLMDCAEKAGVSVRKKEESFSYEEAKSSSNSMIELFRGGGNDTFIISDLDTLKKINKSYSYRLLKDYPGLIPMVVYVEMSDNYRDDFNNLMAGAAVKKNLMVPQFSFDALPFSQRKRENLQVINLEVKENDKVVQYSNESYSKREVGRKLRDDNGVIKHLDNMVTNKGEESLLAIIHADGNNMGAKIQKLLDGKKGYDECVELMRKFTSDTSKAFVDTSKVLDEEVKKIIAENPGINAKKVAYRPIVNDGDDFTFICNARWALRLTRVYLKAVQEYEGYRGFKYSSCAGICIFHSHYPWSVAYSMAEQACDSAKKPVHKDKDKEEGYIDFHYIHSGVGGDLDEIREQLGTDKISNRPYGVCGDIEKYSIEDLDNLAKAINGEDGDAAKLARANLKNVGNLMEESRTLAANQWKRIRYQNPKFRNLEPNDYFLNTVYDLSEIYDLWYTKLKGGDQDVEA